MNPKKPPSTPSIRKERIQANELRVGDSILGMSGKFNRVTDVRYKAGKLEISTDVGENMTLERWQMVAIQR